MVNYLSFELLNCLHIVIKIFKEIYETTTLLLFTGLF